MNALVTGGGGFLGQFIVEQLVRRGDRVRVLGRGRYEALERLGVDTIQGDLCDAETVGRACRGVDTIFHTAAVAGIWGPWKHFYEINYLGTRHVVEAARREGVGRLIFTGSPSVTFGGGDQRGIDESAPYPERWLCYYPQTKAMAERCVLAADRPGSLRTCSLRPHLIWGPRDRHLIPRLLDRARRGRLRRVGDGENMVDMIYVENAAEAHLLAADALADESSPVGGRAYFLSQGEPVRCWRWIDEILALVDLPPVRKAISYRAAWWVGLGFEMVYALLRIRREPMMTRFLAAELAHSHYFDIGRARKDFGYSPRVSTAEGMERLERYLREEGW